jgi:hypothetical protein
MMEGSERTEQQQAAARRTLKALVITVSTLFVGSMLIMAVMGDGVVIEGRRVLAILPFQGSASAPGNPYAGFGEGLAAYFGRADPKDLGVFGPASTSESAESMNDPLAIGRRFDADMVLVGRETSGVLVAELLRVDDGTTLWRGDFAAGPDVDRRGLLIDVATEVTQILDLPR